MQDEGRLLPLVSRESIEHIQTELARLPEGHWGEKMRERFASLKNTNPHLAEYIESAVMQAGARPPQLAVLSAALIVHWLLESQTEANALMEIFR
jgi:hypothetical protein